MKVNYKRGDHVKVQMGYGRTTGTVYTAYDDGQVSVILDGPQPLTSTNRFTFYPEDVQRCED